MKLLTLVKSSGMDTPGAGRSYTLPIAWENAVAAWLAWLSLGGLSEQTLRCRRGQMRAIARRSGTRRPSELTIAILIMLCSQQKWSNDHRKGVRTSLISFFDWAVQNDLVDENPASSLPKVCASKPSPRPAPDQVWHDLISAAPARERLMAMLAGEAGMRRAEVAVCHRDDLLENMDGYSLIVHGKGGKQRVVPITSHLANEIRTYRQRGFVFPGQIDGHISADYVGKIISRLMPDGYSMHKLRHRYATRGYAGTRNLRAVQEALGHASVATTQRYTAVTTSEVRAVSDAARTPDIVA